MSLLLAVCSLLLWERKHVSNLCMAEGSANTKVVLYCWAHHCQVLTSQVSHRVSQTLLIFHFLRLTLSKLYIHVQTISSAFSDLYIYFYFVLVPRFRYIAALCTFPWLFGLQRVCKGKQAMFY